MSYPSKRLRTTLNTLLALVASLVVTGSIFIYSASSVYALELCGAPGYFVKKQIFGIIVGLVAIAAAQLVSTYLVRRGAPLFYLLSIVLTGMTLLDRCTLCIHGSRRWLSIAGITFQPSELLKVALVLYLAYLIDKKDGRRTSFVHGYLPILVAVALPSMILLRQPDFGLTVTLVLTALAMLFIARHSIYYIAYTFVIFVPFALLLILMKPYRLRRFLTFLNPWHDPRGSGFQIIQSLIAIGSGGLGGVGVANSKQKFFYLPMQHTDFIFSIIAEEIGFVGSATLILLFMLFTYAGLRLATLLRDRFAAIATAGFVTLISLQALINISVTTGLVPTKGIGLPFVSYGNTALVANLLMIGIIINFARNDSGTREVA